jgi:hypothetical protein
MIHAGDSAVRMPHLTAIGFQILAGPRAVIGSNILAGPPTDLHSRWKLQRSQFSDPLWGL